MAASDSDAKVGAEDRILQPLEFSAARKRTCSGTLEESDSVETKCIFCDKLFYLNNDRDSFLQHTVVQHKLVIAEYTLIPNFREYIEYWRGHLKDGKLENYCSVIQTNSLSSDPAPSEFYFLLSDILPEDKNLRLKQQQQRLVEVLHQQQWERDDKNFSRGCLFCRQHFEDRHIIFDHVAEAHNLHLGHPDNLVFKDELLDLIQQKLDSLQCLFCEKTFTDRHVLKEHMRKKLHKKINPKNKTYDKFYTVNYLEFGKNWEDIESEDDRDMDDDSESEESDSENALQAVCLFCNFRGVLEDIFSHMKEDHSFDVRHMKEAQNLTFYQQVKIVNYIRRQMHMNMCYICNTKYENRDSLMDHMKDSGHLGQQPDHSAYDHPEYFFPTYEDDNLLCSLEDDDGSDDMSAGRSHQTSTSEDVVIAEDIDLKDIEQRRHLIMTELMDER